MPSNGQKKPETKDKPHQFETHPKKDLVPEIGKMAVKNTLKDKRKK